MNLKNNIRSLVAVIMYLIGIKLKCSTFIDEVSITAGYGKINDFGEFQYPLPKRYIKKHFKGCLKWDDYIAK